MPPTRQDFIQGLFYSGDLGEGEVAYEPRLLCWSVLVESLGAMWTVLAFAKSPRTKPGDCAGHRITRPEGLVQCESMSFAS